MNLFSDAIDEAIQRIARTPDGALMRIGLQRAMMALSPSPESGALQTFEGGRRFAAQIVELMNKTLVGDKVDGQPEHERPIVIVHRQPVSTGSRRGARRRGGSAGGE